jgi:hypothetical protein
MIMPSAFLRMTLRKLASLDRWIISPLATPRTRAFPGPEECAIPRPRNRCGRPQSTGLPPQAHRRGLSARTGPSSAFPQPGPARPARGCSQPPFLTVFPSPSTRSTVTGSGESTTWLTGKLRRACPFGADRRRPRLCGPPRRGPGHRRPPRSASVLRTGLLGAA